MQKARTERAFSHIPSQSRENRLKHQPMCNPPLTEKSAPVA